MGKLKQETKKADYSDVSEDTETSRDKRRDLLREYGYDIKAVRNLEAIKDEISEDIAKMSNQELNEAYKNICTGAQAFVSSLRGQIGGFGKEHVEERVKDALTYSSSLDTKRFAEKCIERGYPKKLKVKRNSRQSEQVSVEDIFIGSCRRIAIMEEYARRNEEY